MAPDPTTCLLLIDNQTSFLHPTHWGTSRSNPSHAPNITALLSAFRHPRTSPPHIIHVQHLSPNPSSKLHPAYIGSPGSGFEGQHGVDFLFYAQPLEGEAVVTKGVNSAFIGTELEGMVRRRGIRTLVIGGITTDQCVSTTTRMAADLGVCEGGWGKVGYALFLFLFLFQCSFIFLSKGGRGGSLSRRCAELGCPYLSSERRSIP